jgi:hypothetical protein
MMLPGWGFAGPAARQFEEQYHCYSVAAADKAHLEVSMNPFCLCLGCMGLSHSTNFSWLVRHFLHLFRTLLERRQDTPTAVGV